MADEVAFSGALIFLKDGLRFAHEVAGTVATSNFLVHTQNLQTVGTSQEILVFSGSTIDGYILVENPSTSVNYVDITTDGDSGFADPITRLAPNRLAIWRKYPSAQFRVKANTAPVDILVSVIGC